MASGHRIAYRSSVTAQWLSIAAPPLVTLGDMMTLAAAPHAARSAPRTVLIALRCYHPPALECWSPTCRQNGRRWLRACSSVYSKSSYAGRVARTIGRTERAWVAAIRSMGARQPIQSSPTTRPCLAERPDERRLLNIRHPRCIQAPRTRALSRCSTVVVDRPYGQAHRFRRSAYPGNPSCTDGSDGG